MIKFLRIIFNVIPLVVLIEKKNQSIVKATKMKSQTIVTDTCLFNEFFSKKKKQKRKEIKSNTILVVRFGFYFVYSFFPVSDQISFELQSISYFKITIEILPLKFYGIY